MRKQDLKCQAFFVFTLLLVFASSGCTVRTYKIVKERQDIEATGNRGYLTGKAPEREGEIATTRTTYVTEIEFGKGGQSTDKVTGQSTYKTDNQFAVEVVNEATDEVVNDVVYEAPEENLK